MRLTAALPLMAALALAACGDKPAGDTPKSLEQVAKEAERMIKPDPGQYESTMKILDLSIPGLPADQAAQMKQMMGAMSEQTQSFCLTEEEANMGFKEMIRKSQHGECSFDRFNATASTIDAKMTCKGEEGEQAIITMKGSMTITSSTMNMEMDQTSPEMPGGKMHIKMQMASKRIGECPA